MRNKEGELFLTLNLGSGGGQGNVETIRFVDRLSTKRKWLSKGALGIWVVRRTVTSRPEAEQELRVIRNVFDRAKTLAKVK
jgi:hypothetical protein